MTFSGGVKLGDLDDFIGLSQECVLPLIQAAGGGNGNTAKLDNASDARVEVASEVMPLVKRPNLIKSKQSEQDPKAQIGQVSLSDCLACSGCVTSAETVLLQEQSVEEFRKRVVDAPLTVVSISSESLASIAANSGLPPGATMLKVAGGLEKLGVAYILECSASEAMALLEGKAEFTKRYRRQQNGRTLRDGKSDNEAMPLPLLTSHCPGWTCYAEKVVEPSVLPHLSPLRPPQQIQGRLVKTYLLEAHNKRVFQRWWRARNPLFGVERWFQFPNTVGSSLLLELPKPLVSRDVYHVSVQPCFDRKLEGARPSFKVDSSSDENVREVDTVLTTTELLDLLECHPGACSSRSYPGPREALDLLPSTAWHSVALTDLSLHPLMGRHKGHLISVYQGRAGGFAEHVFREVAREMFQIEVEGPLEFETKQNEDMREVLLRDTNSKKVLLRFVSAYGFRNIQNVIRKLSKLDLENSVNGNAECGQFVEIMACPGGCLNGAGQWQQQESTAEDKQASRRERLDHLERVLGQGEDTIFVQPADHPLIESLYHYIVHAVDEASLEKKALGDLIGSSEVGRWLSAGWRSLKVDSEGNKIVGTSALKW